MAPPTSGLPPTMRPLLLGSAAVLMVVGAVLSLTGSLLPGGVLIAAGVMEVPIAFFLTRER
ncbi:MAG TPA: hypothetical protein VFN22_07000 [Gemmatimonadales bacterium]|nr:hypothetical protein [Gemmatimonadales bacterium]